MKISALKTLAVTVLVAGLSVLGFAAPAHAAATAAWSGATPTFAVGNSPAMSIDFTPTNVASSATFRQVNVTIKNAMGMSMALASLTSGTASGCLLTSLSGTHVETQGAPSVTCNRINASPASYNQISVANIGQGSATAYGAFTIQIAAGLVAGLTAGNYTVWVATSNDSTIVEEATIAFTVGSSTKTVTFMPNGGSGTPTSQAASTTTNLQANTFTRSGYTFAGWNTASDGSGFAMADGTSYSFSSDRTLYAQWTAVSSSSSPSASASASAGSTASASASLSSSATAEADLASTGVNATGYIVGGLGLVVLGTLALAIMQVIRRRNAR